MASETAASRLTYCIFRNILEHIYTFSRTFKPYSVQCQYTRHFEDGDH